MFSKTLPLGRTAIKGRQVYRTKRDLYSKNFKEKSRLVAKVFSKYFA